MPCVDHGIANLTSPLESTHARTPGDPPPLADHRAKHNQDAPHIGFDALKYGRHLLVDASAVESLPGYITSPQPHSLRFHEIALIDDGQGHVQVAGDTVNVRPCRVLVTAPGEVRSWRLERRRLRGRIAFFEMDFVREFAGTSTADVFPFLHDPRRTRALDLQGSDRRRVARIMDEMRRELENFRADSVHALRAQLYQLLVALQRLFGTLPVPTDPAAAHARRFEQLVDRGFAQSSKVAEYADALRISPRHLNECVRRSTGRTASELIHGRIALEARRMLMQSDATVETVAERLRFSDTSYFVRFFKRHVGVTPAQFRRHRKNPI